MDAEFHRSEEIHTVCRRVFNTVCKKTNIMTNLIRRNAVMPASLDVEHLQDPADGVAGQAQAEGGFGPSPAAARSISPNGKCRKEHLKHITVTHKYKHRLSKLYELHYRASYMFS